MSPLRIGAAALVVLVGVLVLGTGLAQARGSVRSHLAATYEQVPNDQVPGAQPGTVTYRSPRPLLATADEIAGRWRPAARADDPAGVFLRYSSAIVAVTTAPDGQGSLVTYDESGAGYRRWYPYVGGVFGPGGRVGGSFRGGGPGTGK